MKKVIIIGGGIAGLSAGCYAQMNGFDSEIYEMNNISGGLCTAWKRKDYLFDGCLHWLVGTSPANPFYRLWEELGALKGKKFFSYEYFNKIIDEDGRLFTAYVNPYRLREEMLEYSKEDKKLINKIADNMRCLMKIKMPLDFNLLSFFKLLPLIFIFRKYSMGATEFSSLFKNNILRKFIKHTFDWHDMSVAFILWTMALMADGDGQYVLGGALEFARTIESRYKELGGKIFFNKKVKEIIVKNDSAAGILLNDDTEVTGDFVISCADGYTTIFEWLKGNYLNNKIRKYYNELEPFPPLVYVSLGLNSDYSKAPCRLTLLLKKEIDVGGKKINKLECVNKSFDNILAKEGKGILHFIASADYSFWKNLYNNKDKYYETKNKIAEDMITAISEIYPEIRKHIEVIDIATPVTFERYTGNWKGSYEGWLLNKETMSLRLPITLPGLKNFYMAGHWLSPGGGLPSAALTARNAIRVLCHHNKIKFSTTTI